MEGGGSVNSLWGERSQAKLLLVKMGWRKGSELGRAEDEAVGSAQKRKEVQHLGRICMWGAEVRQFW